MTRQIISPGQDYTFHDYFKMRAGTDEIVGYFGYEKRNTVLDLQRTEHQLSDLKSLHGRLEEALIHISLENEITRREFLIAPVMFEVRRATESKLRSEYWFEYNHQLKGSFDYFLRKEQNLLVVEAKNADMTRGFTQLAVEMIALDKADETNQETLYGAVTTGNIWQFGELRRADKLILQDIKSYDLLKDLQDLVRIFVAVLEKQ